MKRVILTASAAVFMLVVSARQTEVLFNFDTEDFTSPVSADGVLELARLFTEEGVTVHFVTVGYMARAFVQRGRWDVIEALKPHLRLNHTISHSVHPNLLEISDVENFDAAYDVVLAREAESIGMVKAATGVDRVWGSVPPGNSDSYVAFYVYARLGLPFYCGAWFAEETPGEDVWFCNLRQIPYGLTWEEFIEKGAKYDPDDFLNRLAKTKRSIVYCHPNKVHAREFWDELNFKGENRHKWGEWEISPQRSPEEVKTYLGRIRELVRRIKGDPRFRITTLAEIDATRKPRRTLTRGDVPAIRAALSASFGPVREPGSWSLSDCFVAAVRFLRGEVDYAPGMAYGFLEKPRGVASTVRVSRRDLVAAARAMDVARFLPASVRVGEIELGPADFLFAALETLETGAEEVTVVPREQLGGFGPFPFLAKMCYTGTWLHSPEFKDKYLSDRMRWQIWTLRYE